MVVLERVVGVLGCIFGVECHAISSGVVECWGSGMILLLENYGGSFEVVGMV